MIIKALCRRYKRWNPVHPTSGAFWGMGIGVGCGVGWGPGFGPDVIGYVGAGCGVGFNVGITFAGVGLGLPANFLIQAPYNAFAATSGNILEFARSNVLFTVRSAAGECWNYSARNISCLRKEASTKLSSFNINLPLNWNLDMNEIKRSISHHAQSALRHSEVLRARHLPPCKGTKD